MVQKLPFTQLPGRREAARGGLLVHGESSGLPVTAMCVTVGSWSVIPYRPPAGDRALDGVSGMRCAGRTQWYPERICPRSTVPAHGQRAFKPQRPVRALVLSTCPRLSSIAGRPSPVA